MELQILSYSKDGIVHISIDGKQYRYFIDSIFIPEFLRITKKSNGRALSFLKEKSRDYETINSQN